MSEETTWEERCREFDSHLYGNSEIDTLRADLAAALGRVGELEEINATLESHFQDECGECDIVQERDQLTRKATTWREAHDAIYAENKQLKRERDEIDESGLAVFWHNKAVEFYRQGFEDCREAAAQRLKRRMIVMSNTPSLPPIYRNWMVEHLTKCMSDIRALTVPERGEGK